MAKENKTAETKEKTAGKEWIGYGIVALLLTALTTVACGYFAADQSIQTALDPAVLSEQFSDGQYAPEDIDPHAYANKQRQNTDLRALYYDEAEKQVDAQVEKDAEAGLRERLAGFPEDFITSALMSETFLEEKKSSKEYSLKQAEKTIDERFEKAEEAAEQKRQSDRTVVSVLYILLLLVPGALLIPVIKWTTMRKGKPVCMSLLPILCGTAVGNLIGFVFVKEAVLQHYGSILIVTDVQAGSLLMLLGITALLPICLLLVTSYFTACVWKERAAQV